MSPNWLNVAGCDVLSTERAKVSTLFDIQQHKRSFYRLQEPKQIIPQGWGWLVEEKTPFPTNTKWCNGKSTNSPQSKLTNFFL